MSFQDGKPRFLYRAAALALLWGAGFFACPVYAQDKSTQPVDLTAEQVVHDDPNQTITALGNVELIQGRRILKADQVSYNLQTDTVTALGNVSFLDDNSDVYFSEYLELTNQMKDGFAQGLQGLLQDGSRLAASQGRRVNGTKFIFEDAVYTPCKPCDDTDKKDPIWQIRAEEVVFDKEKQQVNYKNARFEMVGVPVVYTPYFSHPDPAIKQRSGFLRPGLGWSSELGAQVEGGYYWGLAPHRDATLETQVSAKEGVLVAGEYRQRFVNGEFYGKASITQSDRVEEVSGTDIINRDEVRGHVYSKGLFDINSKWRARYVLDRASDDQYLRQYDIKNDDILKSEAVVERFSGRNYSRIGAFSFQDLRLGSRPDQPDVIPLAEYVAYGEPKKILGGRWMGSVSTLGLTRGNGGQDVNRGSLVAGWDRRLMSNTGLVTDISTRARGDFYAVRDRDLGMAPADDSYGSRFFPNIHTVVRYPVARTFAKTQMVIEPIASVTYGTNLDENNPDIPNEDSLDVQLDATNLFEASRFPGVDQIEDRGHTSYGLRSSVYGFGGNYLTTFVGQSHRFAEDTGLFPAGSGLEEKSSDYVGYIGTGLGEHLRLDYKTQIEQDTLSSRRHELDAQTVYKNLQLNTRYLFANSVDGTGFNESREEIRVGSILKLNQNWSLASNTRYDLGEEPGLRKASGGIYYEDECFSFAVLGDRSLTRRSSGESETTFFLRIGFKNIGEFSTPKFALSEAADEDDG